AYIVAEDLALRQIQQEENLPLIRHVEIGGSAFDGIMLDHDLITCIEVAFVVEPTLRKEKADSIVRKVATAKRNLLKARSRLRIRTMIVVVTQLEDNEFEELRVNLKEHTFNRDQDFDSVEVRFQEFELLQKVYLSD
ncbi:MAG: hypothetical protein JNL64_15745, partial [Blastocatellia bacterium]|nr:hypothetical protein [Blastocatellia bacterium]